MTPMLAHLDIRNIVLIDHLACAVPSGLVALTGETGAGKSILLDALGLVRGDRAGLGLIRAGADQASVTATFDIRPDHPVRRVLLEQGLDPDGDMILRRVVGRDGKSRAFVNDQNVSVQFLKTVAGFLFDIVGQFDAGTLFDPATHRDMLDSFGGLAPLRDQVADAYNALQSARATYQDHIAQTARARADADYIAESIAALRHLGAEAGEEARLLAAKKYLNDQAQIIESVSVAVDRLTGRDGADSKLVQALKSVERLRGKLPEAQIDTWTAMMDTALSATREVAGTIQNAVTSGEEDEGYASVEQIDDRLYALRAAARKFACAVDTLPEKLAEFETQRQKVAEDTNRVQELATAVARAERTYATGADDLSMQRKKVAQKLDRAILAELPPLKLDKARFVTDVMANPETTGPAGYDQVRFCVAMNPGSDPAPLDRVASGGEMSRLMLALKVVLTGAAQSDLTLIFDEIDTGVGGAVADAMGQRLARLARLSQVLAITHAPQVAAHADHHFVVSKKVASGVTTTTLSVLDTIEGRRDDLARMIAGAEVTDEARAAAAKLLSKKVA